MEIIDIIEKKRDKKGLSKDEIEFFVKEYTNNNIPDYQASALIMAMYLNGLNYEETINLTKAMAYSGIVLNLSDISDIIVDKHSTGGVGDKITIILMPIIASLGLNVAKMSGRGLGFTGGTADKLESIPNYNVDINIDEFKQNIKEIGISLITSNADLAPADKKIYALRDTIGCVSNIPLIASSIMSKKIASGANKIVMDVTYGNGAFMKDIEGATELSKIMIEIGKSANIEVRCVITNMDEPVGYTVGNQLEIIEAIEAIQGNMPEDVEEIVYKLGEQVLLMTNKASSEEEANKMIKDTIESGRAFNKFKELVERQGGDVTFISNTSKFESAKNIIPIIANNTGYISGIDTEKVGKTSSMLGAGRKTKDDIIDYRAGITLKKKIGDSVEEGEPIAYIYTNKDDSEADLKELEAAFHITNEPVNKINKVVKIIV